MYDRKRHQGQQSITADWVFTQDLIDGVKVREVKNVPKANGLLTEIFRRDWGLEEGTVDQVFQVTLFPGAVSAWHVHQLTPAPITLMRSGPEGDRG